MLDQAATSNQSGQLVATNGVNQAYLAPFSREVVRVCNF
jgi:hypothetical protein